MDALLPDIAAMANRAMLYELCTYPKFGLVSPYSKGSHRDMDHFTFIDSAAVLTKYMTEFAKAGYGPDDIETVYERSLETGRACETEMFDITHGVNTHKGLIFVLGTLVCATGKCLYDHGKFEDIFLISKELASFKLTELAAGYQSHGKTVYEKFGIKGVRGEAAEGFPTVRQALPHLHLEDKSTLVKTLIYIMSVCDDSTVLYRGGMKALEYVKSKANLLLDTGYTTDELLTAEKEFIGQNISPGGAADLLCATIFLTLIKNKYFTRSE